jgi:hypothetical protein
MKTVHFDLPHLYYLPQVMPVVQVLRSKGSHLSFTVYASDDALDITKDALEKEDLQYVIVADDKDAINHYRQVKPDWIVFGNAPSSSFAALQQESIKLAFMQHGIGPKSCYYTTSEFPFDVRFVEGDIRKARLQEMYPDGTFIDVGYAKLDPLFNENEDDISLSSLGLDPNKKTLLYAPTFYPSSIECFDKNWPKELAQYNLIIKPHFFSLTKKKYAKQRALLEKWNTFENVYVCSIGSYSLIPFMQLADILLSEASSTVFEFAALDKPIVWCDFYHVRWSYKGILKFRFTKRMDQDLELFERICERASSPSDVASCVEHCLAHQEEKSDFRCVTTLSMAGKTDGKCSERIVDYLLVN